MRTKMLLAAALAGAVSTDVAAVPAEAHEGHPSCRAYGQAVSENAQTIQP
jgi:hypothetical protein